MKRTARKGFGRHVWAAAGLAVCSVVFMVFGIGVAVPVAADEDDAARMLQAVRGNGPELRRFLQAFPKGGELHSHLSGAVYAETWLDWAAEDGLCLDKTYKSIVMPGKGGCDADGGITAANARLIEDARRTFIDSVSLRSFLPYAGWSGHNQFFATFARTTARPERFGDMLAAVAERAARQNILYLELMHTLGFGDIFPLVGGLEMTGDVAADYRTLMDSPFGAARGDLVAGMRGQIAAAYARKDALLGCGTDEAKAGCDVEIRLLHQVIREFEPALVFAQFILGWAAVAEEPAYVGMNLVAPEDGFIALRDYTLHMRMIDHLYRNEGPRNVALHAGELTLGLVRPRQLRFHIREAIELGHAKRIGHGVAIAYEDDSHDLLAHMAENGILVEINLTSNDVILGVTGSDHPWALYRAAGVPMALSTDDEGVSRIDLTHEYQRAVTTYDLGYGDLKTLSRASIEYSFLDPEVKERLMLTLEERFRRFEAGAR